MNAELTARISKIFDYAYANSQVRVPAASCKELGKLLHTAMYLEETLGEYPAFRFTTEQQRALASGTTAFATDFYERLVSAYSKMNRAWKIYEDDIRFSKKDVCFICLQLNGIYVSSKEQDVFGDVLEIFRSRWAKQEGGQFFTDQRVTALAMTLLQFDPRKGDDLVDICAGTGGFLLAALKHISNLVGEERNHEANVIKLASMALRGQEIDEQVCTLGNSTLSARLSKKGAGLISQGNSLDRSTFLSKGSRIKVDSHLCAATNPPFGAKIPVRDEEILKQYELSYLSNQTVDGGQYKATKLFSRAPDVLFIEQNVRLLKPGEGRLAIVIPYQILSGPQAMFVRNWILRYAAVEAVIDLPMETFQPHTGTKTSLVLLKRREAPILDISTLKGERIFMSTPRWIGHDRRGHPIFRRAENGSVTTEVLSDFESVQRAYELYLSGKTFSHVHAESFVASVEDIVGDKLLRLNAQYHRPDDSRQTAATRISKNWDVLTIGDVTKRIFYPGRFKREYVDYYHGAVPFLGGSNITELIVKTDKWLRHDDPRLATLAVKDGWLLVTRSGTTGIVSSVPKAWDGFAMSEHVIRIEPNSELLDPAYLLAFLKTRICAREFQKNVFGSVIDEITPESIRDIEIPIPRDRALLDSIIQRVRAAEKAKNAALGNLYSAVSDLDAALSD